MEVLIIPCLTGLASTAYLGVNVSRYLNFMKFKQNNYIDQYHMLQGKVSSLHHYKSLVETHNVLFKDLTISIGKDKTQTNYYPVKIGQTTTVMPHTSRYTKWHDTHKEIRMVNELTLQNKQLQLTFSKSFKWFATNTTNIEEKWKHNHQYYVDLFTKNGIKFHYGDRIKIKEYCIKNNDEIAIFGEYKNGNKEFEVLFCGAQKEVHNQVRNQICQFNDIAIGFALIVLILSVIGSVVIIDEYNHKNKKYTK
ncbi:hypothetical protein Klosneuvirus_5_88 [Klosneuvirus KNV1]|uniref:Uncharacterized protein n=1 Tax=Klosneuvirus KNV1 TaxID=1977640 RepID=A0A1V0SLC3_9VIRU|nr:hypothetical protein Klosneuvirus_5_88 [Klosneuvirus KNV1]